MSNKRLQFNMEKKEMTFLTTYVFPWVSAILVNGPTLFQKLKPKTQHSSLLFFFSPFPYFQSTSKSS